MTRDNSYNAATGLLASAASTNPAAARLISRQYDAIARPTLQRYGAPYSTTAVQAEASWVYDIYTERLQSIRAKRGASTWNDLADTQLFYDASGNVTRTLDWRNPWVFGGQNQCFTYYAQNRLVGAWTHMAPSTCANTSASDSDGTNVADPGTTYRHTYGYNAQGNIVSRQSLWGGTSTWTYNYGGGNAGPHAVSSITVSGVGAGTHSFAYDAAGNMTSRSIVGQGTQSMGYDVFGQMTSLSQGGVTTQYLYDAFGTRVRESGPAGHTVFVDRWAEHDGSFHTQHFFIGDARFAFRYNNSLTYVVSDHLGSVIASSFTFFNDVKFRRYLPFGDVRGSATNVPTPYGYTGQRRDSTNLMWYRSRYYDPLVGRFTQADTIVPDAATPAAFNRYSYVINNPLKYVDPTGHCYGLDAESARRCEAAFVTAGRNVDFGWWFVLDPNRIADFADPAILPGGNDGLVGAAREVWLAGGSDGTAPHPTRSRASCADQGLLTVSGLGAGSTCGEPTKRHHGRALSRGCGHGALQSPVNCEEQDANVGTTRVPNCPAALSTAAGLAGAGGYVRAGGRFAHGQPGAAVGEGAFAAATTAVGEVLGVHPLVTAGATLVDGMCVLAGSD